MAALLRKLQDEFISDVSEGKERNKIQEEFDVLLKSIWGWNSKQTSQHKYSDRSTEQHIDLKSSKVRAAGRHFKPRHREWLIIITDYGSSISSCTSGCLHISGKQQRALWRSFPWREPGMKIRTSAPETQKCENVNKRRFISTTTTCI